eukprot:RCo042172
MLPRLHLFEILDLPQCPEAFRHHVTATLTEMWQVLRYYNQLTPMLEAVVRQTGSRVIVDLASGSGGPLPAIQRSLAQRGLPVKVILTDLVPDLVAYEWEKKGLTNGRSGGLGCELEYLPISVDATACTIEGMRTIFAAFHHFPEALAGQVLQNAVRTRSPIAIFELTERSLLNLLLGPPMFFLLALLLAPFVRPFSWRLLLLSWVIPAIPLVAWFDSLVSTLRTYSPAEVWGMVRSLEGFEEFEWELGTKRVWWGPNVVYYIGYPKASFADPV